MSFRHEVCLWGAAIATGLAMSARADVVLHVDDDAEPGGDGLTWETALQFLQDALAAGPDVVEIRVAQGLYRPDRSTDFPNGSGARSASFRMRSGLTIAGGYAGLGAGDPNARDSRLFQTTLSGDLLGNDEPGFVSHDENSLQVVVANDTDETARLDGVTVIAGYANEIHGVGNGGGFFARDGSPTIVRCRFTGSFAIASGGGLHFSGGSPSVTECVIAMNEADLGGGFWSSEAIPQIVNCLFDMNSAAFGAGMYHSGSDVVVVNCGVTGNSAREWGGGIVIEGGSSEVINSTLAGNSATLGGGVLVGLGDLVVSNSIVWSNSAQEGAQIGLVSASLGVAFSDVQGGQGGISIDEGSTLSWLMGNLDADPLFIDPASSDFRLSTGSPCVDAGDNAAFAGWGSADLDGNPRRIDDPDHPDRGAGDCPIIDMGAFEYQEGTADCCPADLDDSGAVDFGDVLVVLAMWNQQGGRADLDGSGVVDFGDILIILSAWGACP